MRKRRADVGWQAEGLVSSIRPGSHCGDPFVMHVKSVKPSKATPVPVGARHSSEAFSLLKRGADVGGGGGLVCSGRGRPCGGQTGTVFYEVAQGGGLDWAGLGRAGTVSSVPG